MTTNKNAMGLVKGRNPAVNGEYQQTLDIELLQTLVAIAGSGSFAAAARKVYRTQSAVSMQMKRLEAIVGQALFEKQGRRAVLTMQGQNLLLYARRILSLHDEAMATFRSPEMHGEVRLGVCDDYAMNFVPPILVEFAQKYPGVQVRLDCQNSKHLIAATSKGDLDLSLINIVQNDIDCEELIREPLLWVSSSNHLAHEQDPLPLAIENKCLWGKWAQKELADAGKRYRLAYSTFDLGGIVAIVESGLAVSVMSRSSVLPSMRVLSEADGFPPLPATAIGLMLNTSKLSPAAQELANTIRAQITRDLAASEQAA